MVSGFTMYRNQRNKCWNIFVLSDENVLSRIYHNSQKDTTLAKNYNFSGAWMPKIASPALSVSA